MRFMRLLLVILAVSVSLVFLQTRSAYAVFHCMRIHAVMGGFSGADTIQYVELRMNLGGQTLLAPQKIRFYDGSGVLKATFTFPSGVINGLTGDSVLIGTQEFDDNTTGGNADFTFTNGNTVGSNGGDPLHPVQLTDGKVKFAEGFDNCDAGFIAGPGEVDSLAYGGASADFGSAAAALPGPSENKALRLNNLGLTPFNNNTEYPPHPISPSSFAVATGNLATDFSTPRNNGRTVLQLTPPVGGIAELPDVAGAPLEAPDSSGGNTGLLVAVIAAATAAMLTIAGTAWYARRRWLL